MPPTASDAARRNVRLYYAFIFLMDFGLWSGIWIKLHPRPVESQAHHSGLPGRWRGDRQETTSAARPPASASATIRR